MQRKHWLIEIKPCMVAYKYTDLSGGPETIYVFFFLVSCYVNFVLTNKTNVSFCFGGSVFVFGKKLMSSRKIYRTVMMFHSEIFILS